MPTYQKHEPGTFCWSELATTDQEGAKQFYAKLFGWTANDVPMGPGQTYTLLRYNASDTAALYSLMEEQRKQGVPPHWTTYFAVADADASAEKARSLGGAVIFGPMDVSTAGRMAFVRDPEGAIFAVWQARDHIGSQIMHEANTPGWTELAVRNTAPVEAFYTGLFGWSAKKHGPPMNYTEFQVGGKSIGGMLQMTDQWGPNVPAHWLIYFIVGDCNATAARVAELGGSAIVLPQDIPDVGRFAVMRDPQGAVFAFIQPAM